MELTAISPDLLKCFKEFSRETSLFRALPLAAVETVANLLCAVEVEADTTLIKEGSWPVGFYLICEGRQIFIKAEDSSGGPKGRPSVYRCIHR